jgi:hypothetical protein
LITPRADAWVLTSLLLKSEAKLTTEHNENEAVNIAGLFLSSRRLYNPRQALPTESSPYCKSQERLVACT